MKNAKIDIFLSYSTEDSVIANELKGEIEERGIKCFMAEKDIPVGTQWSDRIRNALINSKKIIILITPRSKNRPWVMTETGAAWVLKKNIIPVLMFVSPSELIEPISRFQSRIIETKEQRNNLINDIISDCTANNPKISGCWIDQSDNDIVFFQQRGKKVVGIYDYDGKKRKIGFYFGFFKGRSYEYQWKWYNENIQGHGKMMLSEDNQFLSGKWWYDNNENEVEHVGYDRVDGKMPEWMTESDFNEIWEKYF